MSYKTSSSVFYFQCILTITKWRIFFVYKNQYQAFKFLERFPTKLLYFQQHTNSYFRNRQKSLSDFTKNDDLVFCNNGKTLVKELGFPERSEECLLSIGSSKINLKAVLPQFLSHKIYFLQSHLDFLAETLCAISDEQDERFHQDILYIELR